MIPGFASNLGLSIRKTNVDAQKIDGSALETYKMVTAKFLALDKFTINDRFFEEIFLVADTSMKLVPRMISLFLSNGDVNFSETGKPIWRSYTTVEVISTTNRIQLIDKCKFAKTVLDENSETFVIYIAALDVSEMAIHSS